MADAATRAGASASASASASARDARARDGGALRCEFRVMRLRAPAYEHAGALEGRAIDDGDDGDDARATRGARASGADADADAGRNDDDDARRRRERETTSGELTLPQSFGAVALGERFSSFVTFGNFSEPTSGASGTAREIGIKVELQTETRRTTLRDGTKTPIETLRPGEKVDLIVTKDLKELGAHTLVCSATYYDAAGERKYSPQYFKFNVANPLSVRTKVRAAPRGRAFLEVCIENTTRYALLLDSARFDTVDGILAKDMTPEFGGAAATLHGVDDSPDAGLPSLGKRAVYRLDPSTGAAHYLFEITRANASEEPLTPQTQLGKLELRWRGAMGDPGRLQTQVITAGSAGSTAPSPVAAKMRQSIIVHPRPPDAEDVSTVYAETPFILRAAVEALAPIKADACVVRVKDVVSGVYIDGPRAVRVGALSPGQTVNVDIPCVALGLGVQTCPSLVLCDAVDDAALAAPAPLEVFSVIPPPSVVLDALKRVETIDVASPPVDVAPSLDAPIDSLL